MRSPDDPDRFELGLYPCWCGSCWCPQCATHSRTHDAIRERLEEMDWSLVRHIVLTADRVSHPVAVYDDVRNQKAIPSIIRALKLTHQKWIWILEWHKDGYPHWHLLIESNRGMIGKKLIASKWMYGLVWESYVKSENHWKRIKGYHQHKGYLAGESKAHQLSLPRALRNRSRVRKYGGYVRRIEERAQQEPSACPRKRARDSTYDERFNECGKNTRVNLCGNWSEIHISSATARTLADRYLGDHENCTYHGDHDSLTHVLNEIQGLAR